LSGTGDLRKFDWFAIECGRVRRLAEFAQPWSRRKRTFRFSLTISFARERRLAATRRATGSAGQIAPRENEHA